MSWIQLMHKRMNYLLHRKFTRRKNKNKECRKKGEGVKKGDLVCEQYINACKLR
jgi:hypothetical protein